MPASPWKSIVLRLLAPVVLSSAALGCRSDLSARHVYGAWQLESAGSDSAGAHVVGEVLQLSPGGTATISAPGRPPRWVRFQGFRGQDGFGTEEHFMISLEGDGDAFNVEMPTRNQLTLLGIGDDGMVLTYWRAR
jgi:hypothetical protein